ncbi:hypothetical protein Tco_0820793 [Tanacetum coccineum]|uniref:Reverse transcriptase zinc-binding domain-containing protein n=1 Tax=Tanacetum coccineum TaxID=301880 RepID=A0ABQ5AEQ8_9ASTR
MVAVSDSGRMFGVTMVEIADGWRWILAATGIFTVKKLSHLIDMKLLGSFSLARNHCWVSIKVNVFMWRVANNKLPTFSALATRGISPVTSL